MKNKETRKFGSDNPLSKKVCKLSMNGDFLQIYESMNIAAKENKTFHASISKCCTKLNKIYHSGGFHWCFEHNLFYIQHRCRFIAIFNQLLEKVPKYKEPKKKYIVLPHTEETKKKISESMKKLSFQKRSQTMNVRKLL
jgi:coproporphyrinogen III oxidase